MQIKAKVVNSLLKKNSDKVIALLISENQFYGIIRLFTNYIL